LKITAREKRVITIGAIVAAAVLFIYALSLLLPNRQSLSDTVELKKKMLLRERETLSREGYYRARLDWYGKHLQGDMSRLLPSDNPNVAGAELQKLLKDFSDASGVEITQKNIVPEKRIQNRIMRISVRIETNCVLDQLVQFLTAIANYEKFLTIDEFTITSFRMQKRFEIRPSLTISGYINAPEPNPGEKVPGGI
jgi:hypothetical protein